MGNVDKKEYIERDAFRRRLINRQITANFVNARERHELGCVIEMLDNIPAADVVEVVRCKDCEYISDVPRKLICACPHGRRGALVADNDFCSSGRRKGQK